MHRNEVTRLRQIHHQLQLILLRVAGRVGASNVKAHVTAAGFASPVYTFAVDVDRLEDDVLVIARLKEW